MIDFRYHIVSIVAIFLALAVGIVLGSGPLEDDISGFLEDRTKALAAEKLALQQDVSALEDDLTDAEAYAQLVQPTVLQGALSGSEIALVLLPGASDGDAEAVEESLRAAGAEITENVRVTDAWTDPEQADVLARVTEGLGGEPLDQDTYLAAGALLAGSLVTPSLRLVGGSPPSGITTLAAYEEAGFIQVSDLDAVTLAAAAVVVAGDAAGLDEASAAAQETSLLPLVDALDSSGGGTVVAGPPGSALPTGMVTAVRDSDSADVTSTVDWLDTTAGQTVVALALSEQLRGGVGQYGTEDGAEAVGPDSVLGGG